MGALWFSACTQNSQIVLINCRSPGWCFKTTRWFHDQSRLLNLHQHTHDSSIRADSSFGSWRVLLIVCRAGRVMYLTNMGASILRGRSVRHCVCASIASARQADSCFFFFVFQRYAADTKCREARLVWRRPKRRLVRSHGCSQTAHKLCGGGDRTLHEGAKAIL